MARRHSKGFAVYYTMIAMVVLSGICSLAVDYGRAQVVKVQLRRAADAAARYGASGLQYDSATAVARAMTSASENNTDGANPVVATAKTGHWNATTHQFVANALPMDAIEVQTTHTVPLLFGKLLGRNSCSVTASAVALRIITEPTFIGLNGISGKNNASMGYRSSQGLAGGSNQNGAFIMGSNDDIKFVMNLSVNGTVLLGPDGTFNHSSPAPIHSTLPLSYPSTETPPMATSGDLNVSGVTHVSGGGTKVYTNINFANNAELIFDQPTTVYVTGSINAAQGSIVRAASNVPLDLKIRMTGGPNSVFGGNNANNLVITAQVYAPDTDLISKNNCDVFGSVIFRTIDIQNNLNAYYDLDSGSVVAGLSPLGATRVATVR